ncbi:DUF4269 domain-containing protein [Ornithinibacillus sp. 179-J 7C1 HS]|uniref:DUF4269 domain-containing protein n=1 Tax=Ornithinibacillus sp. 179-J 7C1 HS TaxID=3142384 RepID=UPI00399FAB45
MFDSIEVLKNGSVKQQKAYEAISRLNILKDLAGYNPLLCGTIPLGIDVEQSDLDIIFEVYDFEQFQELIFSLYQDLPSFRMKETVMKGKKVLKANFRYLDFDFELFGQAESTRKQNAFVHMVIEYELLQQYPTIKEKIIRLKHQGIKTEPAFCQVLGIDGDNPYEDLIVYGKELIETKGYYGGNIS